jgi:pyroglutamyl-peptidase
MAADAFLGVTVPAKTKTILLTGFEAFGGEKVNASWLAVRQLHGQTFAGHVVAARRLPTVFGQALGELRLHLERLRPRLTICVGQAAGRAEITPERVAINIDDARIADNDGRRPLERPVVPGGPAAYWSTLPVGAIVRALKRHGIPAAVSLSAGTYVCNHVFYGLMHELAGRAAGRGGFIHVPLLPGQAANHHDQPSLPLALMVEAIELAIKVSLRMPAGMAAGAH